MTLPLAFSPVPVSAQALVINFGFVLLCLGCTHLSRLVLLFLLRRPRTGWEFFVAWLPWGAVMSLVATFILMIMVKGLALTDAAIPPEQRVSWGFFDFSDHLIFIIPLLTIWTGFYLAVRTCRQHQQDLLDRARTEAAARDAELRALKAQINPHFLFNSLNSLRALLPLEQERPRAAVTRLADLLRASLTSNQEALIPLGRELTTVENYLELEQLRHEARLRWRNEAPPATRSRLVPPFLVQDLVENAVKHGIDRREEGGEIALWAGIDEEDRLHLRISSPGILGQGSASTGLGLANARSRLALLFGPRASLALNQASPDRVEAEVRSPAAPVAVAALP